MFENKIINEYTYATRYIASWLKMGGTLLSLEDYNMFKDWLRSLNICKEEINDIVFLATNGKLELEISAKKFIEKL